MIEKIAKLITAVMLIAGAVFVFTEFSDTITDSLSWLDPSISEGESGEENSGGENSDNGNSDNGSSNEGSLGEEKPGEGADDNSTPIDRTQLFINWTFDKTLDLSNSVITYSIKDYYPSEGASRMVLSDRFDFSKTSEYELVNDSEETIYYLAYPYVNGSLYGYMYSVYSLEKGKSVSITENSINLDHFYITMTENSLGSVYLYAVN